MSILIAGATGQIGKDLVNKLSKDYKIFAIYRSKKNKIKNTKNINWIKHDFKKVLKKTLKPRPKYLINCAVDQKFLNEKSYFNYLESNLSILKNMVNYGKKNNIKFFVNLSTVEVYGNITKKIVDEKYTLSTPNKYGFTKNVIEKLLFKEKLNFINIRLPGVLCEPNDNLPNRPWLNSVIKKFKKNKTVFVHNLRTKFNNLTTTTEISNLILFLINKKIIVRDTFNFATSKPVVIEKILLNIKKKLNSRSKINEIKDSKKNSFCISTKKLQKNLNFKISTTTRVLDKYLKNYSENND